MSREQKLLKARLELLKCTPSLTHVISCPFDDGGRGPGAMKASEIAQRHEQPPASYCYFPNEDCPQEIGRAEGLGTGWLQTWMAICDNAKRTGGTAFILFRSDGKGQFESEKGIGTIEGQAQTGEIAYAQRVGCKI